MYGWYISRGTFEIPQNISRYIEGYEFYTI